MSSIIAKTTKTTKTNSTSATNSINSINTMPTNSSSSSSSATKTSKIIIKPLNPESVIYDNIKYSNVKINTEMSLKSVDLSYNNDKDKLLVVARGCIVKTITKVDNIDKKTGKEFVNKDGKPLKEKYQIFMGLKDTKFIDFINNFESSLLQTSIANSDSWFGDKFNEDECKEMLKPIIPVPLPKYEKFGPAMGGLLSYDFVCKSQTEDVSDVSDLLDALKKGTEINVCIRFNSIKLGAGKFSTGYEIAQINIINIGVAYIPFSITLDTYTRGLITLSKQEMHEKGGKFCKVSYDSKPLRLHLEPNSNGRIFKSIDPQNGSESYSISLRLSDDKLRNLIESINQEIFDLLLANSKDYFGAKKTVKLLKAVVKSLVSYNKQDLEKIKQGEKPSYPPSMWIKIYWTSAKGFDGKIINADTGKPFSNPDNIINTNLTIASIDMYSRHIWFGPKGTSINFTLNECIVSSETTEYDMDNTNDDDDDDDNDNDKNKSATVVKQDAYNSDDENEDGSGDNEDDN